MGVVYQHFREFQPAMREIISRALMRLIICFSNSCSWRRVDILRCCLARAWTWRFLVF